MADRSVELEAKFGSGVASGSKQLPFSISPEVLLTPEDQKHKRLMDYIRSIPSIVRHKVGQLSQLREAARIREV